MKSINLGYFKEILEKEKTKLINQLKRFARKSDRNNDWVPKPTESNIQEAEGGERSNVIQTMETDLGVEKELEKSLNDVDRALNRIQDGTYGLCEKEGEPMSEERLEANPSAKTCIKHN